MKTKLENFEIINNYKFEEERSLYSLKNAQVDSCTFAGALDGESPLKESSYIFVNNCSFSLRYALWHNSHSSITNSSFLESARAPFWYCKDLILDQVKSNAVKVFRECKLIDVYNSEIVSEEPFWRCSNIKMKNSKLYGFYAYFECKKVFLDQVNFEGKYSFQYNKNLFINDCVLNTKDAFWHCNHVIVKDSIIKGEYIGWYSKNMTFINCTIESHQPFCYAKNIKLINCKMPNCDLAFENSTVKGNIVGKIESIKNPIKCILKVDEVGELINENALHNVKFKLK